MSRREEAMPLEGCIAPVIPELRSKPKYAELLPQVSVQQVIEREVASKQATKRKRVFPSALALFDARGFTQVSNLIILFFFSFAKKWESAHGKGQRYREWEREGSASTCSRSSFSWWFPLLLAFTPHRHAMSSLISAWTPRGSETSQWRVADVKASMLLLSARSFFFHNIFTAAISLLLHAVANK